MLQHLAGIAVVLSPGAGRYEGPPHRVCLLAALALLAIAGLFGGCAGYEPLPLPTAPRLATSLDALDLRIPAVPGGPPASRVDIGRSLPIEQIGLLAILNDPELRAQQGERLLAQGEERQVVMLPNPSVSINWEALLGGPGIQPNWSVAMTEDITSLITYRRRVRAARAQTAQVEANQLWAEWQVAQKARMLAIDLYWDDQSIDFSEREQHRIEERVSTARKALAANYIDSTALAPLLASEAAIDQSLVTLRSTRESNWHQLDALLGLAPNVRFAIARPPEIELPAGVEKLIANLPQRRPDLIALQLGYHAADENLRAAILSQFPALALGPIWEQDTTNVRSLGPTGTFDIPLFNRNQGNIAIAGATRLQLREQYQGRLDASVAEVRGLIALIARTRTDLVRVQETTEPSEELAREARAAYAEGNLDQRILSDLESAALERELEATALQRTLGEAQVSLALVLALGLPQATLVLPENAK